MTTTHHPPRTLSWLLLLFALAPAQLLTLGQAEHAALTTGFTVRKNYFEEQAREWEKRNAIAGYLPSVAYSFSYSRMDEQLVENANRAFAELGAGFGMLSSVDSTIISQLNELHPGTGDVEDMLRRYTQPAPGGGLSSAQSLYENNFSHNITINQPLTNGGAELYAIRIAKSSKAAIEAQQQSQQLQVLYDTRKGYFDALAAHERTIVARQRLTWARQNLDKSTVRQSSGTVPITDVLQWEADVAQRESEVLDAEALERFLVLNLLQLMGQQHSDKDSLTLTLMPVEEFEAWYQRGPQQTGATLANSPERRALESGTQVSRQMLGIARSQFLPKVNAFAQLSFVDSNAYAFDYQGWTAGVSVNVPLFSGFRSTTNYQKVNNEYRKALLNEQEINNRLSINLRRIELFYQASYQGVGAAHKQHQLMQRQFDIMQQRYDSGLVNQSQLLEVELGARQTRIGYIQKLFECLLLQAEYQKTIGTLEVTQ